MGQAVGEQEGVGGVVGSAGAGFGAVQGRGVSFLTSEGLRGRVCEEYPKGCGGVSGPAVMDGDTECSKGNARILLKTNKKHTTNIILHSGVT